MVLSIQNKITTFLKWIYNLLRMRKLFNLTFNKSIMLEKYLYEQK